MKDLKTLKDLRPIYSHSPLFKNVELCSKQELKQEAVKWVKYYDSLKVEVCSDRKMGKVNNMIMEAKKNVLIEFHNITEEDLNDG